MSAENALLPETLSTRVEALAAQEGLSVKEFIRLAVAEKATEVETRLGERESDYIARRVAEARERESRTGVSARERFLNVIGKASDVEPPPEDRLPEHLQSDE